VGCDQPVARRPIERGIAPSGLRDAIGHARDEDRQHDHERPFRQLERLEFRRVADHRGFGDRDAQDEKRSDDDPHDGHAKTEDERTHGQRDPERVHDEVGIAPPEKRRQHQQQTGRVEHASDGARAKTSPPTSVKGAHLHGAGSAGYLRTL